MKEGLYCTPMVLVGPFFINDSSSAFDNECTGSALIPLLAQHFGVGIALSRFSKFKIFDS